MNDCSSSKVTGMVGLKPLAAAGCLLLGLCFAAYVMLARGEDKNGKAGEADEKPLPRVSVVQLQPQKVVLTTELPGRTAPYLVAEVRPQVSGLIESRSFTEGADVEAGQLLYQIDPKPFQAEVDLNEANLAGAAQEVKRARAALEADQADVKQAQATLDLALKNRTRFEELAKTGAAAISDCDRYVTEAEVAQAALQAAQARLAQDRQVVAVAQAAVAQAEAALKAARINLEYTHLTAPISGRIGKSNVTVGALATAHQTQAFTTIQQMDPIYVDVPQSTADLLRLRRRLEDKQLGSAGESARAVTLLLEDGSQYPLPGTLQFRDVTVDQSTGSVILRMVFENPKGVLLPGMFVRAVVTEGVNDQALLIPQQAVSRDPKGNPLTLVVNAMGEVEQRQLELDRSLGDQWLVTGGVKPGDRVIVEGMLGVRPGSRVSAFPFESKPVRQTASDNDQVTTAQAH